MSTFNPYNRAIKESINVDFRDRHSMQKVILCNRENQFYGEFIGIIKANGATITNGILSNVSLYDTVLYDKEGNPIDLTQMAEDMYAISDAIFETIPYLSGKIDELSSNIIQLSGECSDFQISVFGMSDRLDNRIDEEIEQRQIEDGKIILMFDEKTLELSSMIDYLSGEVSCQNRYFNKKIDETYDKLVEKILNDRHYEFTDYAPDSTVETFEPQKTIVLKDYSVNRMVLGATDAYIYADGNIVGRIINSKNDNEGKVSSFMFQVFKDRDGVDGLIPRTYSFSTNNFIVEVEEDSKITWMKNTDDKYLMEFSFPAKPYLVLSAESEGEAITYGTVQPYDLNGNSLVSGVASFDTMAFNGDKFEFGNEYCYKDFQADTSGKKNRRIIFDPSGNDGVGQFILRDNFEARMYQPLNDESGEFGRIYEDQVVYGDGGILESIGVTASGLTATLNDENGFRNVLSGYEFAKLSSDELDNKTVVIEHESKWYSRDIIDRDDNNAHIGKVIIGVENIDDIFNDSVKDMLQNAVSVKIDAGTFLGTYKLTQKRSEETNEVESYGVIVEAPQPYLGHFGFFINKNLSNILDFVHRMPNKTVYGHFGIDTEITEDDRTYTVHECQVSEDENGKIKFDEEDTGDTTTEYVDWFSPASNEVQTTELKSSSRKQFISIGLPESITYNGQTRSREFILAIDMPDKKFEFTPIVFNDLDYKFISNGIDVTRKFGFFGKRALYRFVETNTENDGKTFAIEDMYNQNLVSYINERLHGGVNYRGVVQVIDHEVEGGWWKTPHLSNLFYYPVKPADDWNYPRPEYEGHEELPLLNGNMFYVGKTENTQTTRWTIDGLELEVGDYIIINKDGVRIQNVTSSDLDVIDTIEKDLIIVDNINVLSAANINNAGISNLTATNENVTNLTVENEAATNITAENEYVSSLTAISSNISSLTATSESVNDITAVNETVTDLTATNETVTNSDISNLTATNEAVTNLTVTSEVVTSSNISNLTATSEFVTSSDITYLTANNENVTNLTVTNETVTNSDITNLSVDTSETVNATITNLTATNSNMENVGISSLCATYSDISAANISSFQATDGNVTNLTSTNLTSDNISVELGDMYFDNGGVVSSAAEISSEFYDKTKKNRDDLDELSADYEILKYRYDKNTFLSSYDRDDDWNARTPDKLVLRDEINPEVFYQLAVRDGMLVVKTIRRENGDVIQRN